jgi:hypothetical protein
MGQLFVLRDAVLERQRADYLKMTNAGQGRFSVIGLHGDHQRVGLAQGG